MYQLRLMFIKYSHVQLQSAEKYSQSIDAAYTHAIHQGWSHIHIDIYLHIECCYRKKFTCSYADFYMHIMQIYMQSWDTIFGNSLRTESRIKKSNMLQTSRTPWLDVLQQWMRVYTCYDGRCDHGGGKPSAWNWIQAGSVLNVQLVVWCTLEQDSCRISSEVEACRLSTNLCICWKGFCQRLAAPSTFGSM